MSDPIQVDDDDDWDQQDNHEAGGGTTITTTTINDEEYLNVDIENSNIEDTILLRQQQQYGNEQMIEDENGINYADGRKYQIQQDFFGGVVGQEGQQLQEEEEEEAVDILDFDESTGGVRGNIMISDSEEGVLLMRFCPHDSSMLYPQEDKRSRTLRHACRLCRYSEESHTPLIYRNRIKKEAINALQNIPSAISDDPTLPRSHNTSCDNCGHNEAVFFQSDTSDVRNDTLALIFVCCNCDHKWVG